MREIACVIVAKRVDWLHPFPLQVHCRQVVDAVYLQLTHGTRYTYSPPWLLHTLQ